MTEGMAAHITAPKGASRSGGPGKATATRRYAAFISYSHADEEVASWLHRRLESYGIPKGIAQGRTRIGKVFRDRVELSAAHDLGGEIRQALEASDSLIVMCSPRSAGSRYVEEEIRTFKALGRGERIFAIIVDGEPHAAGKPGRSASEECFPRALLYRVDDEGQLSDEPEANEPIAADVRTGRDGRENGALKLIAGLLDVGLDELVQRERQAERRRRLRTQAIAGLMAVLALGAAGAGAFAWWQRGVAEMQSARATTNEGLANRNAQEAKANALQAAANAEEAQTKQAEAEREAAIAARRYSNIVALKAGAIEAEGFHETALLMSLYADPAGQRTAASQKYDGKSGYPAARAVLSSAYVAIRLARLFIEDGDVMAVAISPDSKRVAITVGSTVRVRDTASGKTLVTLKGHTASVTSVAFSPDGRRIVTGSSDTTARVWNVRGGKALLTLKGHTDHINSVAYSSDGRRILTGAGSVGDDEPDVTARVWDAETGAQLLVIPGNKYSVRAAFSPDDARILVGTGDGLVRVYSSVDGNLQLSLQSQGKEVKSVAFSPDGRRLVAGTYDGVAVVWDTNGKVRQTLRGHTSIIYAVAFSPDNKRIITASSDTTARVWDAETGAQLLAVPGLDRARSVAFSSDGSHILVGYLGKTARLWDVRDIAPVMTLPGHEKAVLSIALSPDGQRFVTGSDDKTARVWDAKTGAVQLKLVGHASPVSAAWFSADGRRIVTQSSDGTARIWDAASARPLATFTEPGISPRIWITADGARILATSRGGKVRVRDTVTGKLQVALQNSPNEVSSMFVYPDGRRMVGASVRESSAHVWDAVTGNRLFSLEDTGRYVSAIAISPDSRRILTGSADGDVHIWDAETGKHLLAMKGHTYYIISAAFSADGKRIVTASFDGTGRVWDAESGKPLRSVQGSKSARFDPAFSPDGQRILNVLGEDGTSQVLDAESGKLLFTLPEKAQAAVFSTDGQRVIAGSADGIVRVWAIPPIVLADARTQVKLACERVWRTGAPLSFAVADFSRYPELQEETTDSEWPDRLLSPCKPYLPPEAFTIAD